MLRLRQLTDRERRQISRLAHSRTAEVRLVQRAWVIKLSADGETVPNIAERLDVSEKAVRLWLRRFNADGLPAIADSLRTGRPRTYSEEERSHVIAKARSLPPKPKGDAATGNRWTLDQLASELNKEGLPIKRSQIRRILKAARVDWRKPLVEPPDRGLRVITIRGQRYAVSQPGEGRHNVESS